MDVLSLLGVDWYASLFCSFISSEHGIFGVLGDEDCFVFPNIRPVVSEPRQSREMSWFPPAPPPDEGMSMLWWWTEALFGCLLLIAPDALPICLVDSSSCVLSWGSKILSSSRFKWKPLPPPPPSETFEPPTGGIDADFPDFKECFFEWLCCIKVLLPPVPTAFWRS